MTDDHHDLPQQSALEMMREAASYAKESLAIAKKVGDEDTVIKAGRALSDIAGRISRLEDRNSAEHDRRGLRGQVYGEIISWLEDDGSRCPACVTLRERQADSLRKGLGEGDGTP